MDSESNRSLGRRDRPRAVRVGAVVVALVGAFSLTSCGDDDDESPQGAYCEAGDALQESLGALTDLDLIASGTDGLKSAVEDVRGDLGELRSAAGDAAADDVEALDASVGALEDAIADLGGELSAENASAVGAAIGDVGSAAQAVLDTLKDC